MLYFYIIRLLDGSSVVFVLLPTQCPAQCVTQTVMNDLNPLNCLPYIDAPWLTSTLTLMYRQRPLPSPSSALNP